MLREYFETVKGMKNVRILREKIKKNSLISVDGFPMRIRGANETQLSLKGNVQLIVDEKNEELIRRIEKFLEKKNNSEVSEKYDGFSHIDMNELYKVLTDKFINTVYRKRPANQANNLVKNEAVFDGLELHEKAKIINEIVTMLRCDIASTADLKLIKGSANAGNIAMSKSTVGKSRLILINQSVTGLFENRIEL